MPEVSRCLALLASGRRGGGFLHELPCKAYAARRQTSMKRQKSPMATVGEYMGLAFLLPVSSFVGYAIGYLLDKLSHALSLPGIPRDRYCFGIRAAHPAVPARYS